LINLISKKQKNENLMQSDEYYNLEEFFYTAKVTC